VEKKGGGVGEKNVHSSTFLQRYRSKELHCPNALSEHLWAARQKGDEEWGLLPKDLKSEGNAGNQKIPGKRLSSGSSSLKWSGLSTVTRGREICHLAKKHLE